jgi:small subunit ribosomal protein S15
MSLVDANKKKKVIKKYALNEEDTGSPEVQIALFTERINNLKDHLEDNRNDNDSRRGLLKLVGKRKRMLNALKDISEERHDELLKKLKL